MQKIPQLFLFSQNKKDCLGAIVEQTEFTEDIRFNACSEISFTVPQKFYDINTERWVDNSIYDAIEKHKLILSTDDTEYFTFPARKIGDSSYYKHRSWGTRTVAGTGSVNMRYPYNSYLDHFALQEEVELFDCGSGYNYKHWCRLGDAGYTNEGGIVDYSHELWSTTRLEEAADHNAYHAEEEFIPVSPNDTIAFYTGIRSNSTNPHYKWRVYAYTEDNVDSFVGTTSSDNWTLNQPDCSKRVQVKEKLPNGGYIRVWAENSHGNRTLGSDYVSEDNTGSCEYSYNRTTGGGFARWRPPFAGYIKVLSGERRCTSIDNVMDGNTYVGNPLSPKLRWFEIVSVDEDNDGISSTKKVTAYSYEYSLSHTTFSILENTLPLYVPDAILDMVNSDDSWVVENAYNGSGGYFRTFGAQIMRGGILNELLAYLPNWKIGYVSSELMTTYRTLNDADNIDIYSYLMGTIQPTYNCFIVYDDDAMTISAYSLKDIDKLHSNIHLTWDNSIQHFSKSNMDASYFTALRVRAGDDQYGVGLVNPTGNGMIYNFDRILPSLNYSLDGAGSYKRTLANAVSSWLSEYTTQYTSTYQTASKQFIQANMDVIKAESDVSIAMAEYKSICDKINTMLKSNSSPHRCAEKPTASSTILGNAASLYYNAQYQMELANAADIYANAKSRLSTVKTQFESAQSTLQNIAKKLTMNYAQALKANNGNQYAYSSSTTLLSAAEIKELMKYIVEGSWNYENAAFSETYGVEDIYYMLRSVLNEATYDLKHRLSIANFDFTIDSANIMAIPEFEKARGLLRLGHQMYLHIDGSDGVISPMLLEVHINHKNPDDFQFTFTTDTKRKPMQFRYSDLYGTISQTSVTDKSFTFDT